MYVRFNKQGSGILSTPRHYWNHATGIYEPCLWKGRDITKNFKSVISEKEAVRGDLSYRKYRGRALCNNKEMQIGEPAHASYYTHILFALNITFNLGARAVVSPATTSHIKNIGRSISLSSSSSSSTVRRQETWGPVLNTCWSYYKTWFISQVSSAG